MLEYVFRFELESAVEDAVLEWALSGVEDALLEGALSAVFIELAVVIEEELCTSVLEE